MIRDLERLLVEHGLVPAGAVVAMNAERGRNLLVHAFFGERRFFTLKVATDPRIEREYRALSEVHPLLGGMVPAPIADLVAEPLHILVLEGLHYAGLPRRHGQREARRLVEGMTRYLRTAAINLREDRRNPGHSAALEAVLGRMPDSALAAAARQAHEAYEARKFDALPFVKQHSDLTWNNIGLANGGIVILDWEDFGAVALPGFDVATLLTSWLGHDVDLIRRWIETGRPSMFDKIVAALGALYGLDRAGFVTLLPVYYAWFADLKGRLGYFEAIPEIAARNAAALADRLGRETERRAPF